MPALEAQRYSREQRDCTSTLVMSGESVYQKVFPLKVNVFINFLLWQQITRENQLVKGEDLPRLTVFSPDSLGSVALDLGQHSSLWQEHRMNSA